MKRTRTDQLSLLANGLNQCPSEGALVINAGPLLCFCLDAMTAFLCVSACVNMSATWRVSNLREVSVFLSPPRCYPRDVLNGRVPLGTSQEGDLGQGLNQHLTGNSKARGGLLE